MASSFAEKVLKTTALTAKVPESSSPTRKPSGGSMSKKSSISSSSRKYSVRGSIADTANSLLEDNLPEFVFSTRKYLGRGPAYSDATQSAGKRGRRRSSGGESVLVTNRPYAIKDDSRLMGSPYGKELSYERSPRRRSSFAASLEKLSVAFSTPVVSPSPHGFPLGSSPSLEFGDVPGISSSPLVNNAEIARSELQDPGWSVDTQTPQSREQEWEPHQLPETFTDNESATNPLTFSIPPPPVGEVFTSYLPENLSLMTNPLYPSASSPESSPSPRSAPHIDGFNTPAVRINLPNAPSDMSPTPSDMSPISQEEEIDPAESTATFIQKRKAAAATQRQKGLTAIDPNSAASQAIVKRRTQVLGTVQKAKTRLSVLTYEVTRKRRSFKNNCFGRFRRWLYERERKRMLGKGIVVNNLWLKSLKEMEVSYGSPIMVAFSFIRWVFLLNAFLAVLWLAVIIIPFMAKPPKTFSWRLFWSTLGDKNAVKETFQGSNLEKTFVYYGGYTYARSEQLGWYRVDYMYAVMIAATFLFSFICVLVRISSTIMSSGGIPLTARLYPYSALVFASWDFHLINVEAASKLRRSIRMQLKEMLADVIDRDKTSDLRNRLMSAKRATALLILWPLLMAANVAIVVQLVTRADQVNIAFGSSYAQALLLSVLNVVTPMLIRVLVDMEDFRPSTAERVVLMKLFCVRVLNLGSLFYRMFMMLEHTLQVRENQVVIEACQDGNRCYEGFTCCTQRNMTQWNICTDRDIQFCLPACTENAVGIQLLRLIVMTTLINNAYELIYGLGYVWFSSGNKRQLYIEDMAIDVVYVQSLVWVGTCFSPMAAILGFFSNLLTWYGMRFALFRTCGPVGKAHSASRTESLTYGLLLLTLILSTIPATLNVMQRGSGFCGPIHERVSQYTVITTYVKRAPEGLWLTIQWLVNPAILLGIILLLVFGVVLLQSKLVQSGQFLSLTKHELGMQRREASERLTRVRQQNEDSGSDPGLGPSSLSRTSAPAGMPSSLGQVEAFLFSLANEGQEHPPGGQGRSSLLQTTRRRSNQVRNQEHRLSVLHEEKARQAPRARSERASLIYSFLERAFVICGVQRPVKRGGTTRPSADDSSGRFSEDEVRAPIAVIRGFVLPPDAKVTASVPSIWSILTPNSGSSSLWGSLSSEPVSPIRTSVSHSGTAGDTDAMTTARTSLSSPAAAGCPAEAPPTSSTLSATSAISKFFGALRGNPERWRSLQEASISGEVPANTSRTSFSSGTAQVGSMLTAGSSIVSSSSASVHDAGPTTGRASGTSSSNGALRDADAVDKNIGSNGATVPFWRRILGRSNRKSVQRRLKRMSVKPGSRTSPTRSGFGHASPSIATNGIQQWLSRAVEGSSSWGSHPRSPREWGTEKPISLGGEAASIDSTDV